MTGKLTLENRRILVTEVPEGFGYDLLQALIAKKAILIAFAKTTAQIKVFETTYPTLIPILLDFAKSREANQRILCKLPYLDHIINFSGPVFDKWAASIPKYYRPENADKRTTKVDDIVSRLILAGSRSTRVNFSDTGASSSFTGSTASLAATQFTDALRNSFRKLFRGKSVGTGLGSESLPTNHEPAKRSSTVPLPQTSSEPVSPVTPTKRRLSLKLRLRGGSTGTTLKSNDEKLRKSLSKIHRESHKSWEKKTKKLKAKEVKKLNDLTRQVANLKKKEIDSINAANSALNAATLSRSDALSPETAHKIVASREKKAEKDASRMAEKKFVEQKAKLQEDFDANMAVAAQKHYEKVVRKEIEVLEKRALKQQSS